MSQIAASKALSRLLCDTTLGLDDSGPSPGLALRHSINRAAYALSLWKASNFEVGDGVGVSSYTRRFIESSATALLLRVDPIRILALRELQRSGEYQVSKRNLLTIQWSGDILSKDTSNSKRIVDCDPTKIDRSLFSTVSNLTHWKPALENLQTALSTYQIGTPWFIELLKLEPEIFAKSVAGQLNSSFSFFSKGIHSEWVDRRRVTVNSSDCRKYCGSAVKNIAFCAAILSSSSNIRQQISDNSIIRHLQSIELEFGSF